MTRNQLASHNEQMEAHRAAFMAWWSTTMWAGRSDRWAMLTMDMQWKRWMDSARLKLQREKARVE